MNRPGSSMRNLACVFLLLFNAAVVAADTVTESSVTEQQQDLERRYDEKIDAGEMDAWLRRLSARPHHVGSAYGKENADFIAGLFRSWGYDVEIAEYQIVLPVPRTRELELLAPGGFRASLTEDTLEADPSTAVREELLPPYNAYSIDGEVEGELVFVNYGIPEDYEILERHGIDVTGKIAIAKYGKSWRGIKPKLAGEKGAIGTIIYSDPADDGYGMGDVYPAGPYKHESGVQRGSVMDMPTYPGDILTPGTGATKSAKRLALDAAPTVTRIPVLPISQRDALPLLRAIGGSVVPVEWRGDLPITYHFGPGPARVRLKLEFDWREVTAYNVIARLEGSDKPDEWVLRGNHHDGWNHGAADPSSGMVAMLAEAKAVGELAREGARPRRTIVYAAWDAEEQGLIGSTEWVEHHADELREHAVAYINTDGNSRGFVDIGGSHVLEQFFNRIMEDVRDPRMDISLKERRRAWLRLNAEDEKKKEEAKTRGDLRLYPMGSGSDYTPFLQHLGIASANISFGGEGDDGSYHTLYDTYEHYTTWVDPGLAYGVALAQVAGRASLRLANAQRLPFEFSAFADNLALYISELTELADKMRKETADNNEKIDQGIFAAALDPTYTLGPPKRQEPVPHFNFAPLQNSLDRLNAAATLYADAAVDKDVVNDEINRLLFTSERILTRSEGLKGREWYKHHVYAPGFYTGYGVKTLPGVREAIEQRNYAEVDPQIELAASVLNDMAARIELLARSLPIG
ncbi:MAG TPA: M28 family peptidase [Woeseiaceae bacterium]|nr:M28 family peptidase [Woeseiaceae bacterium]